MGNWLERTAALDKIKGQLGEYELTILDDSCSWEYARQELSENSCFGDTRLIIMTSLPTIKGKSSSASRTKVLNELKKILVNVDENTCIVLNGITITAKSFRDAVNGKGKAKVMTYELVLPKAKAARRLIGYFEMLDKTIEYDDAYLMVDSINYNSKDANLDKVFLMGKKIEHLVGGRKKITHDDVISLCSLSPDFLIWNLFNALDTQDFSESLLLVDKIASRSLAFEHEIVMAVSTMIWKFRLLLFVRSGIDNGLKPDEIWSKLNKLVKWDKTGQGVRRKVSPKKTKKDDKNIAMYSKPAFDMLFYNNGGKSTISCYSQEHLSHLLPITQMCLRKIRSGCTDGEIRIVLEILCLVICCQVPYDTAEEILKSNYLL